MDVAETVAQILEVGRSTDPAIAAPGQRALTYEGLRTLVRQTVSSLNELGIGRGDRVAIILPNGPQMATAFLALACAATTAPLNPAYRTEELEFYLSDLRAKALVILDGMPSPARAVAAERGIPVVALVPDASGPAGCFTLRTETAVQDRTTRQGWADPQDCALVLHTSGTTSRPKIVPLTQANLAASAHHISSWLGLSREDVCLNVMPLFHIHGLMAAVLSSMAAGASVYCTPGFNALKFFEWLDESRATWYTAVPTMHQAALLRASRHAEMLQRSRLRFIRSSSAALPPQVMQELEQVYGVPVIEAYGMTEAAHQMASNPLPPAAHFAGTVGVAAGPEITIMDPEGTILAPGSLGEVVIRGRNVMAGYENNPTANATAFSGGWFRTGDQGYLDDAGYLHLTGRLKELINRGGEKISPIEVDQVLLDHPSVEQAVTFAYPHAMLGEDVAAAIVLREGTVADEREMRDFVASHLAPFKVPRKILFLSELPKGPTGKLQRIGLAERLGVSDR